MKREKKNTFNPMVVYMVIILKAIKSSKVQTDKKKNYYLDHLKERKKNEKILNLW